MDKARIEELKKDLSLMNIEEVMEVTGLGKNKVIELMDLPDFPVLKIGKENLVMYESLKDYFRPRRILRGAQ